MPQLELSVKSINLGATSGIPDATFNFQPNNLKIKCHLKAIVSDHLNIYHKKFKTIANNGIFQIDIPLKTKAIYLQVKYKKHITHVYYPEHTSENFTEFNCQVGEIINWCNKVAIDTSGLDHTPLQPGEDRVFGHQLGPCRASRAMAIVHIAMMEACISISGGYTSYIGISRSVDETSHASAIAQATHDTLTSLFPSHKTRLDDVLKNQLNQITDSISKTNGVNLGGNVAQIIIQMRAGDGSNHNEPVIGVDYIPGGKPGEWEQDPISRVPVALGALWSGVTPFVISSASQYRCPPPPTLDTQKYAAAFNEAKSMGGDGIVTATARQSIDTETGIFWAYDGTPSLCAPPRLYNQVAKQILQDKSLSPIEYLRVLTLINVAMADVGIASWESKYYYKLWRPISAIRRASEDGNSDTIQDTSFTPLGAPNSNSNNPNFTPPFPSYPSGHASFGGALFEILRLVLGTDHVSFTFVSDEFNGQTQDNTGKVRPYKPRSYEFLSDAEEENGQSRMFLGIHFYMDKTCGITLGNNVAKHVYNSLY